MIRFFRKSKKCAKKRLLSCIRADRKTVMNLDKMRHEIKEILSKYVALEGEVSLDIKYDDRNRRYIVAGAHFK